MTCSLSLVILAALMFVQSSQPASHSQPEKGNHIPKIPSLYYFSHVLDTATGRPASNLKTTLHKLDSTGQWKELIQKLTNEDGRLGHLVSMEEFTKGVYKLRFDTKAYYDNLNTQTFYPHVEIVFEINKVDEHYHVPLLLSPFGYSTYRGS